jgi:hypothetical protein
LTILKVRDCAAASLAVRTRSYFRNGFLFGIKDFLTIDKAGEYLGLLSSFSSTFHSNISSAEYSPQNIQDIRYFFEAENLIQLGSFELVSCMLESQPF